MALETLEILIEADRSGLTSQLKRAASDIQSFVGQMNRQEVSWTTILSKSITPALIGGIASTFAIAVTEALQFQNSMQQASLGAAGSFKANSAAMSDAVYGASAATGKSAVDVAAALGTIQQNYKDTATAQGMLNVITTEASIRNISAADSAKMLIPLFEQWGITSAPEAATATANLNDAVKTGNIGFEELVGGLTDAGDALRSYVSLGTAAQQVAGISATPGQTSGSTLNALAAMAEGARNPLSQINLLMGSVIAKVKSGDLSGGVAEMTKALQAAGGVAQTLYANIGLTSTNLSILKQGSVKAEQEIAASVAKAQIAIGTGQSALDAQMKANMTATKELQKAWTTFEAALQKFVVPAGVTAMTTVLGDLTASMELMNALAKGGFANTMKDIMTGFATDNGGGFVSFLGDIMKQMAPIGDVINKFIPGSKNVSDLLGTIAYNASPQAYAPDNSNSPATQGGVTANFSLKNNITVLPGQANQTSTQNYSQVVR